MNAFAIIALAGMAVAVPLRANIADETIVELAVATPELSTLVAALKAADLVDTLGGAGPFTVFAPTDAAFAKLPAGTLDALLEPENKAELVKILTYHVAAGKVLAADLKNDEAITTLEGTNVFAKIAGDVVSIQGGAAANLAKVVTADVEASNGVVHIVDTVLIPPKANKTIVELAVDNPALSTLVKALTAADLVDALGGAGPFTVFAPTDAAFAKLPAATLDALLDPENKAVLVKILKYHVAAGKVLAADLKNDEAITTLEGANVTAKIAGIVVSIQGGPVNNLARVVTADVEASNGVVHIVDTLLIPLA